MVKQSAVYIYHRIPHSNQKGQTTDIANNLDESPIMLNEKKKDNFLKVTYYIILYLCNIFEITKF